MGFPFRFRFFKGFFAIFLHACAVNNSILCKISMLVKTLFLLENNIFVLSLLQEVYGMMPRVSVNF